MARISTYTKDTVISDNDLLVGSNYIRTYNGKKEYNTRSFLMSDLATYFDKKITDFRILDEDNMASNSDIYPPSQQSVKAYVDTQVSSEDTLAEMNDTNIGSLASANILIYDGSDSWDNKALSGDATIATTGALTLASSQTNITSILNTSLVTGRDADNQIKYSTDNQIIFRVDGGDNVVFKTSGEIEATSLDISGDADIDGTLEADAITVDGTTLSEYIADTTGAMFTSNTETFITATYDDSDNTIDLVVPVKDEDNMASDSASHLSTQQSIKAYVDDKIQTQEEVEDIVGGMLDGTETFISVDYDDTDGNIDFVVPVKDEDNMASNSATHLATQQSIKAYVDAQVDTEDTLAELDDTNIGSAAAGQILVYDNTASVWDNVALTAGDLIDVTGGDGTLEIDVDLTEAAEAAIANGDYMLFLDGGATGTPKKEALHDIATLFSGTGLTATNSVIAVDAAQTQITSVGTLAAGAISSGFGSIDNGSSTFNTGAATVDSLSVSDGNITNVDDIALDTISADGTTINVAMTDNTDGAFSVKQGSDKYIAIDTTDTGEDIAIGTGVSGTAITIGHTTSETTVQDNLTVTGNLKVNGDQVYQNVSSMAVTDPIISLQTGTDGANLGADSNKDVGLAMFWHNGSAAKTAFLGFDDSAGKLTFIPDASISSEVASGSGGIMVANLEGNVTGDVTGTSSLVTVTDSTANTDFPVVFNNESNGLLDDTGAFEYNPSTGTLIVANLDIGTNVDVDGTLEADVLTVDGTNILTGGIITSLGTITQDTVTFTSANANDPLVIIQNTTNDATAAALRFNKNRGADAQDNDMLGRIDFYGYDDGTPSTQHYAQIGVSVKDASSGAEGGEMFFGVANHDGGMENGLVLSDGSADGEIDVTIGSGTSSVTTLAGEVRVNSYLRLYTTDDQANNWYLYTHTDDAFRMNYNGSGSDELIMDTSGRIGIGGNPQSTIRLSVRGLTDTSDDYAFEAANSSGNSLFLVRSDGVVGVGTAPKSLLHVKNQGNNWEDGILIEHDSGNTGWNLHPENNSDNSLWFGYNAATDNALTSQTATTVLKLNSDKSAYFEGLIVANSVAADKQIQFNRTGGNTFSIEHDTSQIYFWNSTTSVAPLKFSNASDSTFAGNVGIGGAPSYELDVNKSEAGGVVDIRTINTDTSNTSSGARLISAVGGAGSGDPRLVLSVLATQEYHVGIDNSDSDKLKIGAGSTPGTTSYITMTATGDVGIGGVSPSYPFHVEHNAGDTWTGMIYNTGAAGSADAGSGLIVRTDANASDDKMILGLYANGGYQMVARSNGRVGIGLTAPACGLDIEGGDNTAAKIKITNTNATDNSWSIYANYNTQDLIFLADSTEVFRLQQAGPHATITGVNATRNSYTDTLVINGGTTVAHPYSGFGMGINFKGDDYSDEQRNYASIRAIMESSHTSTSDVGDLGFKSFLSFYTNTGGAEDTDITEKMRITSDGNLVVGGTSIGANGSLTFTTSASGGSNGAGRILFNRATTTASSNVIEFNNAGTASGSISYTNTATTFATSSDYRLKEDLQDFNGLELVSNIKVYDFKWKPDDMRGYGVMAHELQEIIPQAVVGEKDGEQMQQADYSKIVPVLLKSIQELEARVKELENK